MAPQEMEAQVPKEVTGAVARAIQGSPSGALGVTGCVFRNKSVSDPGLHNTQ